MRKLQAQFKEEAKAERELQRQEVELLRQELAKGNQAAQAATELLSKQILAFETGRKEEERKILAVRTQLNDEMSLLRTDLNGLAACALDSALSLFYEDLAVSVRSLTFDVHTIRPMEDS